GPSRSACKTAPQRPCPRSLPSKNRSRPIICSMQSGPTSGAASARTRGAITSERSSSRRTRASGVFCEEKSPRVECRFLSGSIVMRANPHEELAMKEKDLTITISVDQTPEVAFAAINDVRAWWSGNIEGKTTSAGDEFTYRYKDLHYTKHRITESIPGKRVVWLILESQLAFVEDKN